MKRNVLLLFLALCLTYSCAKNDVIIPYQNDNSEQIETIPLEEALSLLDKCIATMYSPATRASEKQYDVSKIRTICRSDLFGPKTKSSEGTLIPDTLLYVINFENDNGFAVLAANTVLSERVFCITENGSLQVDTVLNALPDPDAFGPQVLAQQDREMTEAEIEADTMYIVGLSSDEAPSMVNELIQYRLIVDIDNYENTHVKPEEKVVDGVVYTECRYTYGPYLKTKWDQYSPFNDIISDNPRIPVGCVAIATGQIMVNRRYASTTNFNGVECSWDALESVYNYSSPADSGSFEAQNQAANFIYELGKKHNLNTKYAKNEEEGSSALPKNARRTLQNYGYSHVRMYCGFGKHNQKIARDILMAGRPVFLGGNQCTSGHAWVLDGYYSYMNTSMFHVNWGWGGQADGYYACGLFDTTQRSSTDDEIDGETEDLIPGNHNYTWCFRMVTYD